MNYFSRYVVDNGKQVNEEALIGVQKVNAAEWDQLNEDTNLAAVFTRDEYPDENFAVSYGNHVLDIIEGVGLLHIVTRCFHEVR